MTFRFRLALLALLAGASFSLAFDPTREPVARDGTRATIDLPKSQHMRNTGGSDGPNGPGSGSGLCVFTSVEHAARWQNVRTLDGFQTWMTRRPGGGWPGKLDKMFAQFCAEKGANVPPYIQHTGGDETFLELALKTGRMPAVTYNGRDDFYRGVIAHMVSLAHLDSQRAAIIDNNRPGVWLWMTRGEFLSRWRGSGGGWAVVLLDPPPIPHPTDKVTLLEPRRIPLTNLSLVIPREVDAEEAARKFREMGAGPVFGQCPGGRCVYPPAIPAPLAPVEGHGPQPFGNPPTDRHEWGQFADGGWGWRLKADAIEAGVPVENFGVELDKVHGRKTYSINGHEVTREEALSVFGDGLKDDSDRWNLAAVGPADLLARVKADVAALSADARGKLHVQLYAPDRWEVSAFKLAPGVTLRKPAPAVRRSGAVGAIPAGEYGAAKLGALLESEGGPLWRPNPAPKQPDPLEPAPDVKPAPAPKQPDPDSDNWCLALLAALALLIREAFNRKDK